MSGTSLDGIDVAIVRFEGEEERPARTELVAFETAPYDRAFRTRLGAAFDEATAAELCALGFELGHRLADALEGALEACGLAPEDLAAVGSHGQTVWHAPPDGAPGSTLQIGEPAVIAERTGVPVVADFRVRDVAAGGQGAPLTAYFDRLLLASDLEARAVQNLGGMGNVTALPRAGEGLDPIAFDTGPGVALIDGCVRWLTSGRRSFDEEGHLAAAGRVAESALAEWLEDPFFSAAPPRSTGRERFGERRLHAWLARHSDLAPEDLVGTLTELTARSVAESYRWIGFELDAVYLCGGGARNPELKRRIAHRLSPIPVAHLTDLGWPGGAREAAAFALLARQHLLGVAAGPAWATGAAGPRVLGKLTPP